MKTDQEYEKLIKKEFGLTANSSGVDFTFI